MRKINWLVIHTAATRPSMDIGVKEIRRWHKKRGFADIGYHYVIRRDGRVEKGRADTRQGAHVRGIIVTLLAFLSPVELMREPSNQKTTTQQPNGRR